MFDHQYSLINKGLVRLQASDLLESAVDQFLRHP